MQHECVVKYIHLKDLDHTHLHNLSDYEYSTAHLTHSDYPDLEAKVHAACPEGFVCVDPIALHHQLLWESSLRATHLGVIERDNLYHAIDAGDYSDIQWGKTNTPPISICVEIEARQNNALGGKLTEQYLPFG